MTVQISPYPLFRATDNTGAPLVAGQLFTFVAGTTTPQVTYVDSSQTTQNTNPVILNSRGEASVWLDVNLAYKLVLEDSVGNVIWSQDNILNTLSGVVYASKAFSTAKVNTNAVSIDSALFLPAVSAGIYTFDSVLYFNTLGGSGSNPGASLAVGFSGSLDNTAGNAYVVTGVSNAAVVTTISGVNSGIILLSLLSGASPSANTLSIKGTLKCLTAGTLSIQWAQQTSSASQVNLNAGSSLSLIRIN